MPWVRWIHQPRSGRKHCPGVKVALASTWEHFSSPLPFPVAKGIARGWAVPWTNLLLILLSPKCSPLPCPCCCQPSVASPCPTPPQRSAHSSLSCWGHPATAHARGLQMKVSLGGTGTSPRCCPLRAGLNLAVQMLPCLEMTPVRAEFELEGPCVCL